MQIKFYLDEDIPLSLAQSMINRGINVVTTQSAENKGLSDEEQLKYAKQESRVLLTHNTSDFIKIHKKYIERNLKHAGIIVTDQLPIGVLLKRTMRLWFTLSSDEMENRLEFLSNWK